MERPASNPLYGATSYAEAVVTWKGRVPDDPEPALDLTMKHIYMRWGMTIHSA